MGNSVVNLTLALLLGFGCALPASAAARLVAPGREQVTEQAEDKADEQTSHTRLKAGTAPSFDCSSTRHEIQDLVCEDQELSALDRKLADLFERGLTTLEAMPNSAPQVRHFKAYELRWSRKRNECAESRDPRACTLESYQRRISELQARFLMAKSRPPVTYECRNNPKNELVATFLETEPASVRLTHGDAVTVAVEARSGSGARYLGERGVTFWIKGDDATVTWPKGTQFTCTVRK
jgi:uncharacterized protein